MDPRFFAKRAAALSDSSLKEVLETHPGIISFAGGLPDEQAFPIEQIQEILRRVASSPRAWQYLPTEGDPALREAVAEHVASFGIQADVDNILITQGSQQALDLISMAFIDPGDKVLMEAPGYLGAIGAVQNYEAEIVDIPVGEEGVDPTHLAQAPPGAKFFYTVSTFHNPTGCSIPVDKRRELLKVAEAKNFLIVEDGAYRELRFDGDAAPPIKSFDTSGRVIYLGSFSKALVPGVRVGWIVAAKEIIERLALLKQAVDLASNTLGQLFVLHWLREYGLRPPIELYKDKRDRALTALEKEMPPEVKWNRPQGGFFLWVRLPAFLDATAMLSTARQEGVTYVPGAAFRGAPSSLRFSFSQVRPEEIAPGVERLARVIAKELERARKRTSKSPVA
ncbi:MAG TPA: PLP-dependent aminotransferase family protein [Limnochordia bacterium]|nr:PLP-dependent aminotransferase family protein [Limnochordia bacterium]